MKNFINILNEMHHEKVEKEHSEYVINKANGEIIYLDFCFWCNAFNNGKGKRDEKIFAKYLKKENIELNFWQKKHLAEKYFNWIFEWSDDNQKWITYKIKKECTL